MDIHGKEPDGKSATAGPAKLRPAPRTETLPRGLSSKPDDGLEVDTPHDPFSRKPHEVLGRRTHPASPKVPFGQPLRTLVAAGDAKPLPPPEKHGLRRGLRRFFTSRRKGSHRIVTFIVLPTAVIVAFGVIFLVLKYF